MQDGDCTGCTYAMIHINNEEEVFTKCRRFPPIVFVHEGEISQGWPDVWKRCGEYRGEEEPTTVVLRKGEELHHLVTDFNNGEDSDNFSGFWFVYGIDMNAYPLYASRYELTAQRFATNLGYPVRVKFWEFGTEWGEK